jgi:hypothetical protein
VARPRSTLASWASGASSRRVIFLSQTGDRFEGEKRERDLRMRKKWSVPDFRGSVFRLSTLVHL